MVSFLFPTKQLHPSVDFILTASLESQPAALFSILALIESIPSQWQNAGGVKALAGRQTDLI